MESKLLTDSMAYESGLRNTLRWVLGLPNSAPSPPLGKVGQAELASKQMEMP
jgi:hypothetical protein